VADGNIARMMGKPNRAGLTLEAALLLTWGIGLLVCHEGDPQLDVAGDRLAVGPITDAGRLSRISTQIGSFESTRRVVRSALEMRCPDLVETFKALPAEERRPATLRWVPQ
jgi:hypothetical protein